MHPQEDNAPLISVKGRKVALGPYTYEHHKMTLVSLQDTAVAILSGNIFDVSNPEFDPADFKGLAKNAALFTVFELENLEVIGNCGLRDIDYRQGTATFGISIFRKEFWGKGYGTEATRLTVDYGFRFLNLHNIYLRVTGFNRRAQSAYLKAGFKEIGRRREAVLIGNQRFDVIFMDCLNQDFESPVPGWALPF
jgi:RimJ/RimL family protein N-acetyltransferase